MKKEVTIALLAFFVGLVNAVAASPFKSASGNSLLHTQSNVFFSANVGLFERANTRIYDSQGRDVSARYLLDTLIIAEVYVYPVGAYAKDLSGEFQIQQRAIGQLNKKVKLISQESVHTNQNGRSIAGLHANYELTRHLFSDSDQRSGSQLFVFRDGVWFVAYRFSYPRERPDIANKHIGDFLRQWHWRERITHA
jgi:hypothetical protein